MFFSQLGGRPILDRNGEKIASLKDLIVRINPVVGRSEERYPPLAGMLAHTSGREFWIPAQQVESFEDTRIKLYSASVSLERF